MEENEGVKDDVTETKTERPLFDATSIRDNINEGVVDRTNPEEQSNSEIIRSETHCGKVTAEAVDRSESVATCAEDSGVVTEPTHVSESHCCGDQERSGEVKEHSDVREDQVTDTDSEVREDQVTDTDSEVREDQVTDADSEVREDQVTDTDSEVREDQVTDADSEVREDQVTDADSEVREDQVTDTDSEVREDQVTDTDSEVREDQVTDTDSEVREDQVTDTDSEVREDQVTDTDSEVRDQSCTLAQPVHKHVQESEQLHRKYLAEEQTNVITSQHSPKERQIVTAHQGEVMSPAACQLVTEDTVTVSKPKLLYPHSALAEVRTKLEQDMRSHHGLEAARHVSPVVSCVTDVVRPLTEEQLATIYWNPELCHNEKFIEAFLQVCP